MSIDCRFQRVRDAFNPDNANPDGQPFTWEEVYAGWRSDELQYYWTRLPLVEVPFDRDARRARVLAPGPPTKASARAVRPGPLGAALDQLGACRRKGL